MGSGAGMNWTSGKPEMDIHNTHRGKKQKDYHRCGWVITVPFWGTLNMIVVYWVQFLATTKIVIVK